VGRFEVRHIFKVTYVEIYMEKVQDLLVPTRRVDSSHQLKVREHPKMGTYVEGATIVEVESFQDIRDLLDLGNENRVTASTSMNSVSSRSHAVFTIQYVVR
jgi:hypothetical protein